MTVSQSNMQNIDINTYLIGGCAPCVDGSPEDIIARHCENILGTRDVHLGFCVEQYRVYFIAMPSRHIEPGIEPATPLLYALPAHPQHKGDGIYRLSHLGRSHIAVKTGNQFRVMSNYDEVIDDFIGLQNLPVYILNGVVPERLYRLPELYRQAIEKFNRPMQWIAIAGIVLGTLLTGAAKLYEATQIEIPDYVTPALKRAEVLAQEIKTTQPLVSHLSRFDTVSAVAIRAGGWIEHYSVNAAGQESFHIMLPEWVSRDYIEALGPQVVTDLAGDGLIQAVKGGKKSEVAKP